MAHFAQLDENNNVLQVIVVSNACLMNADGFEVEQLGIEFCKSLFGADTNWMQTSYNNKFRERYAGIGYTYDAAKDAFIAPKPYPSWSLDSNNNWQPPTPYPDDGKPYAWDEQTLSWIEAN